VRVHGIDAHGQHAAALRVNLVNQLLPDGRPEAFGQTHRFAELSVVLVQPGVFPARGRVLVVAGGVDAVVSGAEAARVAVEPGAVRVEDDLAPLSPRMWHGLPLV